MSHENFITGLLGPWQEVHGTRYHSVSLLRTSKFFSWNHGVNIQKRIRREELIIDIVRKTCNRQLKMSDLLKDMRRASITYDIPRTTVKHYIRETRGKWKTGEGAKSYLNKQEELELSECIRGMEMRCWPS